MSKKGRKRKLGAEDKAVFEWEKDRILPENLRDEMETMWEIPQIYHFLQLTKEALNILHLSMYEVERMLLMPKASKQLAHIMTCLLSSPSTTKAKLHRVPPMPYEFWTNILTYKLRSWFKIYQTKHEDPIKVFDTLGVEPEFWKIFPDAAAIEGKDFQDFSFRQRVWLLKTICDTAMHSRKTIQDELGKQPWESQFETVLGIDRYGARYIYFPQFLHNDLRVYRHCLDNKILSTVKPPKVKVKPKLEAALKEEPKAVPRVLSRRKKRRSRWSIGSLPQKKKEKRKAELSSFDHSMIDTNSNSTDGHFCRSSRSSSKASELSNNSFAKSTSGYETNVSTDVVADSTHTTKKNEKEADDAKDVSELVDGLKTQIEGAVESCNKKTEEVKAVDDVDKSVIAGSKTEDSVAKESSFTTVDDLSKSSKTDDEKLEEISSMNASKVNEKPGDADVQLFSGLAKDVNISKSDDEKLSESKKCDTSADTECLNDEMSLDKWMLARKKDENANENFSNSDNDGVSDSALSGSGARRSARIKHISEIKLEVEDAENLLDVCESEQLSSIDLRDSLCRVSSPEEEDCSNFGFTETAWKVEDFNTLISDLSVSNFQLVADSLDSLKDLTDYIASDRTIPRHEIKKDHFVRASCEDKLLKRMKVLSASLEKVETILKESTKKARNKLQREWNNFENGVVDEDQDASTEDGLSSNGWVVGSQGCQALQAFGADRTLALPPATLPPASTREIARPSSPDTAQTSASTSVRQEVADGDDIRVSGIEEEEPEGAAAASARQKGGQYPRQRKQKADKSFGKVERQEKEREGAAAEKREEAGRTAAASEGQAKGEAGEDCQREKGGDEKKDEGQNVPPQTTRVLRARGVSSYTEQLFSDDESEEEKLEGWTDIEAIYATPSAQISASSPNTPSKARDSCNDSEKEDSDQDWILPSSRKRKIKRPSASRRLKSFQHKLQSIKVDHDAKLTDDQHPFDHIGDTKAAGISAIIPGHARSKLPKQPLPPLRPITAKRASGGGGAMYPLAAGTAGSSTTTVPSYNAAVKAEPQDPNLHSVLDIKDEGPIYDTNATAGQEVVNSACVQPNYVVVTTGHAPVANYYVMQQNPPVTAVVQQSQFIQPAAFVSQMVPQQVQTAEGYYVQQNPGQNYIVQNPPGLIATSPRQAFIATTASPQVVYQQQQQQQQQHPGAPQLVPPQQQMMQTGAANYVQYVTAPQHQQQQPGQPRIINTTTLTPPRQIAYRMRTPLPNNRMPLPARQQNFPHPNGAVIRSAPITANVLRPGQRLGQPRAVAPKRQNSTRIPNPNKPVKPSANTPDSQKTTSLIVLSDSDDEIEMIITEDKGATGKAKAKPASGQQQQEPQGAQEQPPKGKFPAELMQRMSEGGISISPIKPAQPTASSQNTQLVVVVNETGSHYALALPNGSKLILTPEQVAQIRASNGGKLVL